MPLMWKRTAVKTGVPDVFPDTLEGFGYYFNADGELRSLARDEKFQFEVKKDDPSYNQLHYNALAEVIKKHIYYLLVDQEGLEKILIPTDAVLGEPKSFIFMSKNIEKYDKILVLIHGAAPVRAGQWARRLIINDSLKSGSQLPYVQEAKKRGYGVVVTNTNQATDVETGEGPVRGSESPEDHFLYVWDKIIHRTKVQNIAIMAHSYGGVVVVNCAMKRLGEVKERVFAVAMSDSVHAAVHHRRSPQMQCFKDWFKEHAMNWVTSNLPLDTHVDSPNGIDSKRVSAGTIHHIETSWKAFSSVFKFFEDKLNQRLGATSRLDRSLSAPASTNKHQQGKNGAASDLSPVHVSLPPSLARVENMSEGNNLKSGVQDAEELQSEEPMSQGLPSSPKAIENSDINEIEDCTGSNRKAPVENEEPMDDPKSHSEL